MAYPLITFGTYIFDRESVGLMLLHIFFYRREQCGLRRFSRFSDMTDVINVETVDRLSRVYAHVDDIDLFTGGLSERPVTGGVVGPTFACIIGQQFLNLRKGDRFWYENGNHPGAFRADQLQEIRRASLSRVICDNLDDIESLQPFAFLTVDGFSNQRKACKGTGNRARA